jgi:hypothetical protein
MKTLADSTEIFQLKLRLTGAPGESFTVTMDNTPLALSVIDENLTSFPALSNSGETTIALNISGTIHTEAGDSVNNVTVALTGDDNQVDVTAADGHYGFSTIDIRGDFTVTPMKNDSISNGIRTSYNFMQ